MPVALMGWLIEIVFRCFWYAIKKLLMFVWTFLCFVLRKFMNLETNLNWFGVLIWFAGLAVNLRAVYITFLKDTQLASDDQKERLADEKAILWAVSQFLYFLGSSVAPRNEDHAEAIAAFKRELEDKNLYIGIVRDELESLRKQIKNLEEQNTRALIDNRVLQEEHMRAVGQLVLENEALKEELKRVKGGNDG